MSIRRRRPPRRSADSPVELRFIDLFMLIVAALIFLVLSLSILNFLPGTAARETALRVVSAALPPALVGSDYGAYLAGDGGQAPYGWVIREGRLPEGLQLDQATGFISGEPAKAETTRFVVELRDGRNAAAARAIDMVTVQDVRGERLRLGGDSILLPESKTGVAYKHSIPVRDGKPPYKFTIRTGALPPGISLTTNGRVKGTADVDEWDSGLIDPWRFVVQVGDSSGLTFSQELQLKVRYYEIPTRSTRIKGTLTTATWTLLKWVLLPIVIVVLALLCVVALLGFRGGRTAGFGGLPGGYAWLKERYPDSWRRR